MSPPKKNQRCKPTEAEHQPEQDNGHQTKPTVIARFLRLGVYVCVCVCVLCALHEWGLEIGMKEPLGEALSPSPSEGRSVGESQPLTFCTLLGRGKTVGTVSRALDGQQCTFQFWCFFLTQQENRIPGHLSEPPQLTPPTPCPRVGRLGLRLGALVHLVVVGRRGPGGGRRRGRPQLPAAVAEHGAAPRPGPRRPPGGGAWGWMVPTLPPSPDRLAALLR